MNSLPPPVSSALGDLLPALAELGFSPSLDRFSPESFGNFLVTFSGPLEFSIARDRGQLIVDGGKARLEPLGLWRAFNGTNELSVPLLVWLRRAVL